MHTLPKELEHIIVNDDKILVEVINEELTNSGIILHSKSRREQLKAIVHLVGPGREAKRNSARLPLTVRQGDVILIQNGTGFEVNVNGKKFLLFKGEESIIGSVQDGGRISTN